MSNPTATLSPTDVAAIQQCSAINTMTAKVYYRLGIVYSTVSYMRSKIKNDSVLCFQRDGQKEFGSAKHYVSFCTNNCSSTECSFPCQHVVIVTPYEVLPSTWNNSRAEGAAARHIHHVQLLSRYIQCTYINQLHIL